MDETGWTNTLTLLAATIVVDNRVYKEEVDSFLDQVEWLHVQISSPTLMTRKMAFDWFVAHRDHIQLQMRGEASAAYVVRLLQSLHNSPHHALILRAMYAVSVADSEFHVVEVDLIDLAAAIWGVTWSPTGSGLGPGPEFAD